MRWAVYSPLTPYFLPPFLKVYPMQPDEAIELAERSFGLSFSHEQVALLVQYVDLLTDWSARVRLISRNDRNLIWERHILDCLSLVPHLPIDGPLLDLGSGGGLPGIVIRIMRSDLEVYLLEPARMKTLFLKETITALGLQNTFAIRSRAETLIGDSPFAGKFLIGTARAVAKLPKLWNWVEPLLAPQGVLIAMKGPGSLREFTNGVPDHIYAAETTLRERKRSFVFIKRC